MNLKEAKTYALDELKLEKDFVRTFGKLTTTQAWLDAIAAVEAAATISLEAVFVEDEAAAATAVEETAELSLEALEDASAAIPLPWEAAPENSLIAFWESEPEQAPQQPLAVLPPLDEAWDDPEPRSPGPAAVVVYPVVIALMMLWAMVQVLLLGGKGVCWVLTQTAERLDTMAQKRLKEHRESGLASTESEMTFATA